MSIRKKRKDFIISKGVIMKLKRLNIIALGLFSSILISSCTSKKEIAYRDDVYQSNARAVERAYVSPDYYYSEEPVADELYQDDGYYSDEYLDDSGDFYSDELTDSEYANRFNRFYYNTPGSSYFDSYYGYGYFSHNSWYMNPYLSPSFYYGYNPYMMNSMWMDWGMYDPFYGYGHYSFYPSYRMRYGLGFGYNPYYYSRYDRFGYGGYGYGMGYGYPYYGNNYYYAPQRDMSVRASGRDQMNIRTSRSNTRSSDVIVERSANGRISTRVAENSRGNAGDVRGSEGRVINRERPTSASRDNSTINRGTPSRVGTTTRGTTTVRPTQQGQNRGTGAISRGTQGTVRQGTTRPTGNQAVRPSNNNRGTTTQGTRPTTTRPTTTRPTTTRPGNNTVRPSGSTTRQPATQQAQPQRNSTPPASVAPARTNPASSGSSGNSNTRTTTTSSSRNNSRGGN